MRQLCALGARKILTPLNERTIIRAALASGTAAEEGFGLANYYKVLHIERQAELSDIKRAFRRLLKRFHPDQNRANAAWAEQRTREIVEAYHVLSDARRRKFHDQQLRRQGAIVAVDPNAVRFCQGGDGAAATCHRILEGLLNGNGATAIELYETLRGKRRSFDLYPYLSLKDHLDCKFLLGEAYEQQGNLREALGLYEEVYREEREGPRLRYFFEEVRDRIVSIYCQHVPRETAPPEAIEYFLHALTLGLPTKDRAEIRKRLAETLLKTGDKESARRELREALRLRPGLKGVQRLASRLGMQVPTV